MRLIGAGLGRTGTNSLRLALNELLDQPCHHMFEVFINPEQAPVWEAAARGDMPDWASFLSGYDAIVDWPGAAFWPELTAAFPEAVVLLSVRDLDEWYTSASHTIFADPEAGTTGHPMMSMWRAITSTRFTDRLDDRAAATEAAARHNSAVLAGIDRSRLVVWNVADGWEPLCAALGVAVPDEPFPRSNSTEEFIARRSTTPQ
jgi:hypothetical protein